MPERYGPWKTVYERFRRWSADGTPGPVAGPCPAGLRRRRRRRLDDRVRRLHHRARPPAHSRSEKRGTWPG
ncbi:hypothetical protein ABZZ16_28875 [Streptomyces sp. NPDC006386]|uniref:hypothetical protein n=1 Tax=Streptomyces sp. NPDC006386 TaxID=3156762 RepID=UPI0033B4EEE3